MRFEKHGGKQKWCANVFRGIADLSHEMAQPQTGPLYLLTPRVGWNGVNWFSSLRASAREWPDEG
jgi:hypothetical protein